MSQEMDALKAAIAKETTVTNSLRVLLGSIKGNLDAALAKLSSIVPVDDTADLRALSASLLADVDANAAALVANTPAAPAPTEPAPVVAPVEPSSPAPADPVSTPEAPAAGSTSESSAS